MTSKAFEKAKWIWIFDGNGADQYAEFFDTVTYSGDAILKISCDSDYAVFLNGKYVASGQYGDFEHYKIYDEIDLSEMLTEGDNALKILAYHTGAATSRYRPAKAGLLYEVTAGDTVIAYSREGVPSRKSPNYRSGLCRFLSVQLGFTFEYDSTAEETNLTPSVEVEKYCRLLPRPIKRQKILKKREMKSVKALSPNHYLVDLGGECVGLPQLELYSDTEQWVKVAFGEHIKDGRVRDTIGARNFYYRYKAKIGENAFTEYMIRLGCRYLEISSEEPLELRYAGLLPQVYEVEELPVRLENALDKRIYDACVNTLRLCMMEHYVDCPWREQALYAFDSRNQMLSGYYAFSDGNRDYARANLLLISEDRREDNLLSITYPSGTELAIPSFSLHYVTAVLEYTEHTGDTTLAKEVLPKLRSIIDAFLKRLQGGLISRFCGENMWNFYDWSEGANYKLGEAVGEDLFLNCLLVIALKSHGKICQILSFFDPYEEIVPQMITAIREAFLTDKRLFKAEKTKELLTILGNSLAILAGVATNEEAKIICEKIAHGELIDCSLSAKVTEYSALISVDAEKYKPFILDEIRRDYSKMLESGSDTVWETLGGCDDFSGAGSLCHGWSAIPVYFYHSLGAVKPSPVG